MALSNASLVNKLDRDLFKGDIDDQEELMRRLNILVEVIHVMFTQLSGDLIVNEFVNYFSTTTVVDPNVEPVDGLNDFIFGFNAKGETVAYRVNDDGRVVKS